MSVTASAAHRRSGRLCGSDYPIRFAARAPTIRWASWMRMRHRPSSARITTASPSNSPGVRELDRRSVITVRCLRHFDFYQLSRACSLNETAITWRRSTGRAPSMRLQGCTSRPACRTRHVAARQLNGDPSARCIADALICPWRGRRTLGPGRRGPTHRRLVETKKLPAGPCFPVVRERDR
jgi:hypothetical protein